MFYLSHKIFKRLYILVKREPDNPFSHRSTAGASSEIAEMTQSLRHSEDKDLDFNRVQWAWEESMGWDCIFAVNLLMRE